MEPTGRCTAIPLPAQTHVHRAFTACDDWTECNLHSDKQKDVLHWRSKDMHLYSKRVAVLFGGLLMALAFVAAPATHADEWNRSTRFSINQQFQVPNATLDANTNYVMKLLDSPSERHVVQVFNDDQSRLLSMFIAISSEQMRPAEGTEFTFMEVDPGYAKPIQKWFYPGRTIGLEFIYSPQQLTEIAAHQGGRSITTLSAEVIPAPVEEPTQIAEAQPTEIPRAEPEPEVAPAPAPEPEPPAAVEQPAPEPEPAPAEELPKTAGELPFIGLIGLLSLGAGLTLR